MIDSGGGFVDSYGAVLINAKGEVLLRQPTGQFGGYAWTFAKGKAVAGESPSEAALRNVLEETGWAAEILEELPGAFAGTTSTTKFYLAGRTDAPGDHDAHTAAIRWVNFEEAAELVRLSPNAVGRERDLAILRAAKEVKSNLSWADRPAACEEDGKGFIRPLPERRAEIRVDLRYDEASMRLIRKGFYPVDSDEKWFIWFRDNVLYLHRSWTGFCIYEVHFEQVEDGWQATSALVNRDPEQYQQTNDDEDRRLLVEMIDLHLLNDQYEHPQPFGGALALAAQPNYLGSPTVVSGLLKEVIEVAVAYCKGETNFNAAWGVIYDMSQEIAEGSEYVRMPGWHTPKALGQTLYKSFKIWFDPYAADDLGHAISEALMAIFLRVRDMLVAFQQDPLAQWEAHALPQLNALHQWAVTVFLGTNEVLHPGVSIDDFRWREVA